MELDTPDVRELIRRALAEDIGTGDITSGTVIPPDTRTRARFITKEEGVIAGLPLIEMVYRQIDMEVRVSIMCEDGHQAGKGMCIAELEGRARSILAGERLALNFLQRLSGIATLTNKFVKRVIHLGAKILDTRKTTPGLRYLEKYAVRMGGGSNHRMGLYDAILIKDNHLAILRASGVANPFREAVAKARAGAPPGTPIGVETRTLDEVREAIAASPDVIMLDNFGLDEIRQASTLIRNSAGASVDHGSGTPSSRRILIEVSGGVTLSTVSDIAACGVDFISVGALTHSASALDISMKIMPR